MTHPDGGRVDLVTCVAESIGGCGISLVGNAGLQRLVLTAGSQVKQPSKRRVLSKLLVCDKHGRYSTNAVVKRAPWL